MMDKIAVDLSNYRIQKAQDLLAQADLLFQTLVLRC